jgi:hypothetical protein
MEAAPARFFGCSWAIVKHVVDDIGLRDVTRQRAERCVGVVVVDGHLEVRVDFRDPVPLGLRIHCGARDAAIRRLFRTAHGTEGSAANVMCFSLRERDDAYRLVQRLRREMCRIALQPISPRHVERVLDIRGAERLRWSKDGRLVRSGTGQMHRGQTITFPTYPPEEIELIEANPGLVARWREHERTLGVA